MIKCSFNHFFLNVIIFYNSKIVFFGEIIVYLGRGLGYLNKEVKNEKAFGPDGRDFPGGMLGVF